MVLVLGKGESGLGAVELLGKKGIEHIVLGENDDISAYLPRVEYAVVSPGIPPNSRQILELNRNNVRIISEIELAYQHCPSQVIAVTGTNGKSTTTSLVHHILGTAGYNSRLTGNIGTAFSRASASGLDYSDVVSLEVSSFQLCNIETFRPHIACILNITPDHLDYHESMTKYVRAKFNITLNQKEDDYLILSADSIDCAYLRMLDFRAKIVFFSTRARVAGTYIFNNVIFHEGEEIMPVKEIPLIGTHNLQNVLASVAIATTFGIEPAEIRRAVASFKPLHHRLEVVRTLNGTCYINDSKATNIDSALCGARALTSSTVMLVGGSDKGYEFDQLFSMLPDTVVHVIAFGETAERIVQASQRIGYPSVTRVANLSEAIDASRNHKAENVLLAPCCASFDQYKSYAQRGEHFTVLVNALK